MMVQLLKLQLSGGDLVRKDKLLIPPCVIKSLLDRAKYFYEGIMAYKNISGVSMESARDMGPWFLRSIATGNYVNGASYIFWLRPRNSQRYCTLC